MPRAEGVAGGVPHVVLVAFGTVNEFGVGDQPQHVHVFGARRVVLEPSEDENNVIKVTTAAAKGTSMIDHHFLPQGPQGICEQSGEMGVAPLLASLPRWCRILQCPSQMGTRFADLCSQTRPVPRDWRQSRWCGRCNLIGVDLRGRYICVLANPDLRHQTKLTRGAPDPVYDACRTQTSHGAPGEGLGIFGRQTG